MSGGAGRMWLDTCCLSKAGLRSVVLALWVKQIRESCCLGETNPKEYETCCPSDARSKKCELFCLGEAV